MNTDESQNNIVVDDESVESLEPYWLLALTSKKAMTRAGISRF
jgi:hypothetical protein